VDDSTRVAIGGVLFVAGFAWFAVIKVWRFFSLEHSARMFWLHLTAPVVGSALMLAGVLLVATSDRLQHRNAAEPGVAPARSKHNR
jgi:hypothetical protein